LDALFPFHTSAQPDRLIAPGDESLGPSAEPRRYDVLLTPFEAEEVLRVSIRGLARVEDQVTALLKTPRADITVTQLRGRAGYRLRDRRLIPADAIAGGSHEGQEEQTTQSSGSGSLCAAAPLSSPLPPTRIRPEVSHASPIPTGARGCRYSPEEDWPTRRASWRPSPADK